MLDGPGPLMKCCFWAGCTYHVMYLGSDPNRCVKCKETMQISSFYKAAITHNKRAHSATSRSSWAGRSGLSRAVVCCQLVKCRKSHGTGSHTLPVVTISAILASIPIFPVPVILCITVPLTAYVWLATYPAYFNGIWDAYRSTGLRERSRVSRRSRS